MSSSHARSTQSRRIKGLSCCIPSPCNHQETMESDLLFQAAALGLEQQCHHLEKQPHTRQHQAGIWRGRRNLRNNFQMIQLNRKGHKLLHVC